MASGDFQRYAGTDSAVINKPNFARNDMTGRVFVYSASIATTTTTTTYRRLTIQKDVIFVKTTLQ